MDNIKSKSKNHTAYRRVSEQKVWVLLIGNDNEIENTIVEEWSFYWEYIKILFLINKYQWLKYDKDNAKIALIFKEIWVKKNQKILLSRIIVKDSFFFKYFFLVVG